jgi:dTDP-4-dehydrorhamnose 3,5-epimerase
MQRLQTRLDGLVHLAPTVHGDARGFFIETFRADTAQRYGIPTDFVQDNHSRSRYGTVRGLHFQIGAGASKLVRCGRGTIVDVLVDLRRDSPTYGEWEAYELSDETMRVIYAPVGFGHGFCVTSDVADVIYKQSNYYSADVERGISFVDPDVGVEWPVPESDWIFSDRDRDAPTLEAFAAELPF